MNRNAPSWSENEELAPREVATNTLPLDPEYIEWKPWIILWENVAEVWKKFVIEEKRVSWETRNKINRIISSTYTHWWTPLVGEQIVINNTVTYDKFWSIVASDAADQWIVVFYKDGIDYYVPLNLIAKIYPSWAYTLIDTETISIEEINQIHAQNATIVGSAYMPSQVLFTQSPEDVLLVDDIAKKLNQRFKERFDWDIYGAAQDKHFVDVTTTWSDGNTLNKAMKNTWPDTDISRDGHTDVSVRLDQATIWWENISIVWSQVTKDTHVWDVSVNASFRPDVAQWNDAPLNTASVWWWYDNSIPISEQTAIWISASWNVDFGGSAWEYRWGNQDLPVRTRGSAGAAISHSLPISNGNVTAAAWMWYWFDTRDPALYATPWWGEAFSWVEWFRVWWGVRYERNLWAEKRLSVWAKSQYAWWKWSAIYDTWKNRQLDVELFGELRTKRLTASLSWKYTDYNWFRENSDNYNWNNVVTLSGNVSYTIPIQDNESAIQLYLWYQHYIPDNRDVLQGFTNQPWVKVWVKWTF